LSFKTLLFLLGGQQHRTGLQIDITGTEGVLRVTNPRAFENKGDNLIEGVNGDATTLSPITVPEEYQSLPVSHLDASLQDVAYLYSAYVRDRKNGTSEASNFGDAVRQHKLINQIFQTSENFFGSVLGNALVLRILNGPRVSANVNHLYVKSPSRTNGNGQIYLQS
jgi:predicted dehydrogenase